MKQYSKYLVIKTIRAPEKRTKRGKKIWYKTFSEGEKVKGYELEQAKIGTSVRLVPQIIVEGRWRIPLSHVEWIKDVESGSMDEVSAVTAEAKEDIKKIVDRKAIKDIIYGSKTSLNGALIGLIGGIIVSWYFKKSKFAGALIGSVAGGYLGYALGKNKKTHKITEEIKKEEAEMQESKKTKKKQ